VGTSSPCRWRGDLLTVGDVVGGDGSARVPWIVVGVVVLIVVLVHMTQRARAKSQECSNRQLIKPPMSEIVMPTFSNACKDQRR